MAIGTMGLALAGSAIGGIAQASAASKAAKAQQAAADAQIGLQTRIYDETTGRFAPFLDSGTLAQQALAFEMGLGQRPMIGGTPLEVSEFQQGGTPPPAGARFVSPEPGSAGYWLDANGQALSGQYGQPGQTMFRAGDRTFDTREAATAFARSNMTGGTPFSGFQKTPGYDFQLQQGMDALQSTAAGRRNLLSGATIQAAQGFGQGLANQEYGNYLARLGGMAQGGQSAAGNMAAAGANFGAQAGNALAGMGNAQAAGAIGVGNAITGGINNAMGVMGWMGAQPKQTAPTANGRPWWLGTG